MISAQSISIQSMPIKLSREISNLLKSWGSLFLCLKIFLLSCLSASLLLRTCFLSCSFLFRLLWFSEQFSRGCSPRPISIFFSLRGVTGRALRSPFTFAASSPNMFNKEFMGWLNCNHLSEHCRCCRNVPLAFSAVFCYTMEKCMMRRCFVSYQFKASVRFLCRLRYFLSYRCFPAPRGTARLCAAGKPRF